MPVRPLIIHLLDPKDKDCGELCTRCLQIMKGNVAPTQKIHLRCFGGTVEQVVGSVSVVLFGIYRIGLMISRKQLFGKFRGVIFFQRRIQTTSCHRERWQTRLPLLEMWKCCGQNQERGYRRYSRSDSCQHQGVTYARSMLLRLDRIISLTITLQSH